MIGTDAFFNDGTVAPIAGVVVNKCKPYQEASTGTTRKRLLNKTLGTATHYSRERYNCSGITFVLLV